MSKSLKVIYENGVLRPLEPVTFHEQEQMTVLVLGQDQSSPEYPVANCYDAAVRSGIIGMVENAPSDLSTNPKYFEGFGH